MFPVNYSKDPGGLLTQEEAIKLIANKIEEAGKISSELQVIKSGRSPDDDARFHSANAEVFALEWAIELIKRITPSPNNHRQALIQIAESLEDKANQLRRQASSGVINED